MERTALLVIDMQNRFRSIAAAGKIIDPILSMVKLFKKAGGRVVFTQHHDVPGSASKLNTWWNTPIIKGKER
jgi:nicotinamidase-related amidase